MMSTASPTARRAHTLAIPADAEAAVASAVAVIHPLLAVVFGSRARGDGSADSDLDVLFVLADADDLAAVARQARTALGRHRTPIDLLIVTRAEFERNRLLPWSVVATAMREGRVIHEHQA